MISSCINTRGGPFLMRILYRNANTKSLPRWSRTYTLPTTRNDDPPYSNPLGIQLLPPSVLSQLFPHPQSSQQLPTPDLVSLSRSHLARHNLLTKPPSSAPPIAFELPNLTGETLDEHFYKIGMESSEPYLHYAREFAAVELLKPPGRNKWVRRSGWTKYYADGRTEAVAAPEEECLVFDVEVLYKISPFAVMACAASPHAWYAWLSPWVLGETKNDRQLIPLGDPGKPRIIVGHNVGYDRSRVKEEYNLVQTASAYLDTMSLHVASNGMAAKQKSKWMKRKGGIPATSGNEGGNEGGAVAPESGGGDGNWVGQSSLNSLKDVALFHCGIEMDKTARNQFGILSPAGVREQLEELLTYCAEDVVVTHKVYQKVLPGFLEVCPHPVSFAALRHISSAILPVNRGWEAYIANAEATYRRLSDGVKERLINLAEEALALKDMPEIYTTDPWLRQLDWLGQEPKTVKGRSKGDLPRLVARQKLPGMPNWYKGLFSNSSSPISLTVRARISPLLLRMMWDGYPLVWSDLYGWTFRVSKRPGDQDVDMADAVTKHEKTVLKCNMELETNPELRDDTEGVYFKLPHKDGPTARCASPLARGYQRYFDSGTLSSEYALAKEALDMNAKCAYWISARERIMEQFVVWQGDTDVGLNPTENPEVGIILPRIIPMGTVTRRAVEATWLTAPPATPLRIGSEIKAMVTPPPGYVFVGADVDSEELWIASLVGDAVFGFHGGNALGFMNLEGMKAERTDVHSKTAEMLGITRDGAKVINYSRIYGAGPNFAAMMLMQLNPILTHAQASFVVEEMYRVTKGRRTSRKGIHKRGFWRGGAESFIFNKLESFAEQEAPRTPVLGAGITMALTRKYLSAREFMPSRINWVMQSSGVDYLHLLLVAMEYLIRRFNISARVSITIHDEVRYLCKEEDKYRCAMALQVANVWTRAMFSEQMGINDLPQSVAYFSAVDIDHILRKEVDMPCITPSHPVPIPHGESLDITALLAKGAEAMLDLSTVPRGPKIELGRWEYTPREPVMKMYRSEDTMAYLKAQIARGDTELKEIIEERVREIVDRKDIIEDGEEIFEEEELWEGVTKGLKTKEDKAKQKGKGNKAKENKAKENKAKEKEVKEKEKGAKEKEVGGEAAREKAREKKEAREKKAGEKKEGEKKTKAEKRIEVAEKRERRARKKKITEFEDKVKLAENVLADLKLQIMSEPGGAIDEKPVVKYQVRYERVRMLRRLRDLQKKMDRVGGGGMHQTELKEMQEIRDEEKKRKEVKDERKRERQLLKAKKQELRAEKKAKKNAVRKVKHGMGERDKMAGPLTQRAY